MPLTGAYLSDAPATIPLWCFDEVSGIWREDGSATKVGNNYVGEVSHFTFWNFDWPNQSTFISGKLVCDSIAIAGALVLVKNSTGRVMGADYTDNMGNYSIRIPQSISLDLEIYQPGTCNSTPYYSANVGSFISTTAIPNINACPNSTNTGTLTATLEDCNGNPVTNGVLEVNNGIYTSYFYPNSLGVISASLVYCAATSVSVKGHDFTNLKSSTPLSISTGLTMNVGTISVCNTNANQFINYILDGDTNSIILGQLGDRLTLTQFGASNNGTQINCANGNFTKEIFTSFFGTSVGTYNLGSIYVNSLTANTTNIYITITSCGSTVGSFVTGSFSGTFVENTVGTNHIINGNFNLKRNN